MAHKSQDELRTKVENSFKNVSVGDIYYHYKNPDQHYEIVAVGLFEENEEPCVVYKALYGERLTWVRTLKAFSEIVSLNEKTFPKFTKIK